MSGDHDKYHGTAEVVENEEIMLYYDEVYEEGYREGMQKMREVGQQRIEELEANLAKVLKALKDLADCVDDGCYCSDERMATVMSEAYSIFRELKEKNT